MRQTESDYVVFIHRLYSNGVPKLGGLDYIIDYLHEHGKKILVFESPLMPSLVNKISIKLHAPNSVKIVKEFTVPVKNSYLVWLFGIISDFVFSLLLAKRGSKVISSDPLSSFPAILLRKVGFFSYHYYHCTDYSEIRFSNRLVNYLYRGLLSLSIGQADVVGCVSKRIRDAVSTYKNNAIIYIPNSPSFNKYEIFRKKLSQRDPNTLVLTCAGISERYKVIDTLKLVKKLTETIKDIKLRIIGKTDLDAEYFKKVQDFIKSESIEENVEIVGYVSREENCELISNSYIGLAFYNKNDTYSWYSDPLKIREYAALGIPCVADLITSAAEEMAEAKAGFAVETFDLAYEKIKLLLANLTLYSELSENSLKWAEKCNKDILVKNLVNSYLER